MEGREERLAILILAAGKGKRMKNPDLPKVLVELAQKPLIEHVLNEAAKLEPDEIVIVVGNHKELVIDYINTLDYSNIKFVEQREQLGTGHAAAQAEPELYNYPGDVLILCGDVPLLSAKTLKEFINEHTKTQADISVLTAFASNPAGYGRIIRDDSNEFKKITEEKDATDAECTVSEINSGVYLLKAGLLFSSLKEVSNNNAQQEYYLTDIIEIALKKNHKVIATAAATFDELQGINSPEDLQKAEEYYLSLTKN